VPVFPLPAEQERMENMGECIGMAVLMGIGPRFQLSLSAVAAGVFVRANNVSKRRACASFRKWKGACVHDTINVCTIVEPIGGPDGDRWCSGTQTTSQ
jgi:hypothetical protein